MVYENFPEDETYDKKKDKKTMIICIAISLVLAYLIYNAFFCQHSQPSSLLDSMPRTIYLTV